MLCGSETMKNENFREAIAIEARYKKNIKVLWFNRKLKGFKVITKEIR